MERQALARTGTHICPSVPQGRKRRGRFLGSREEDLPEHPRWQPGPERCRIGGPAQAIGPPGRPANQRTTASEGGLWLLMTKQSPFVLLHLLSLSLSLHLSCLSLFSLQHPPTHPSILPAPRRGTERQLLTRGGRPSLAVWTTPLPLHPLPLPLLPSHSSPSACCPMILFTPPHHHHLCTSVFHITQVTITLASCNVHEMMINGNRFLGLVL